jgi:hypothetical protein
VAGKVLETDTNSEPVYTANVTLARRRAIVVKRTRANQHVDDVGDLHVDGDEVGD